ncbi:MAG: bifunctional phosphoribosylaminoimidazolecarboxamide formyltransferase/IMP cyclohydrolase [Actinomycetia bacterium]|nr:bifunctional phosphoribosylaminoimidazolecarboxamide formyltransferase/IMP cyclohydrolase [Actinomycetes bacterium]
MIRLPVRRALISVSDKTGVVALGRRLDAAGVEIVSSGGTARVLRDAGVPVTAIVDVTGAPEMLGGRVKTLHPIVFGAILVDLDSPSHRADLEERGIEPFELVIVNLYPFEETITAEPSEAEAIEQIDVGGPAMIRAAAKNHAGVAVVVSPDRYDDIADAVEQGGTTREFRFELAREAFFRTAAYDAAIVNWLERDGAERLVLPMEKVASLRYGENPHQPAAMYATPGLDGWWARAEQLQGKEMSFNNYADANAAWHLANDLPAGSVAILKHMNACGAATGSTMVEAFERAWECDPLSAFGGVVALNGVLDEDTATAISRFFVEVVIAPEITDGAKATLERKKGLRLLIAPPPSPFDLDMRAIDDGYLIQKRDVVTVDTTTWESKTRDPTASEIRDLEMAWVIAAHTKSNAIVLVNNGAAVGVGAGDQSRIGAAERALAKAGDRSRGAACASDAFFPFRDGPDVLASAGIVAIVEPGGSVRDDEVIKSASEHGVALMFTGERHFRH